MISVGEEEESLSVEKDEEESGDESDIHFPLEYESDKEGPDDESFGPLPGQRRNDGTSSRMQPSQEARDDSYEDKPYTDYHAQLARQKSRK